MPNDPVSAALDSAKKALSGANRFTSSVEGSSPGRFAPKAVAAKPAAAPAPKPTGLVGEAADAGAGIKARMENAAQVKTQGSFKKGGPVKKTGNYKLHEGEHVIDADTTSQLKQSIIDKATDALGSKKSSKPEMRIQPVADKRYVVNHSYPNSMEKIDSDKPTTHAVSNLKELIAHVTNHYADEPESQEAPAAKDE